MVNRSTQPKSATSYKDTALGILSRPQVVELEEQGVKKGLEYILRLRRAKTVITPQVIREIHKESFGFIFPDWAGTFRRIEVVVGDYEPPNFSSIPEHIKNLCDDLNVRLKHIPKRNDHEEYIIAVVHLVAWFQSRFVWIHPFQDYNGRVGRLLTNLILLNLDLPVIEIEADKDTDRDRYIQAIKKADNFEYAELEGLISKALRENLEKL